MPFRSVSGPGASRRSRRRRLADSTKAGLAMRFPSPIRFLADRRGNVAMMYALMLPVLMFGAGFAVDYTHAKQVQTKLDAAADAAVLAALTPAMMEQTERDGEDGGDKPLHCRGATLMARSSPRTPSSPSTSAVPPPAAGAAHRHGQLHRRQQNIFAGILGYSALQITGSSTANASIAPNIDFYLLLDNSPSMALPGTTGGLSLLQSLTTQQETGGCAFACHQADTNPYSNPSSLGQNCTGPDPGYGTTNRGCSNRTTILSAIFAPMGRRRPSPPTWSAPGTCSAKHRSGKWTTMRSLVTRTSPCASTSSPAV